MPETGGKPAIRPRKPDVGVVIAAGGTGRRMGAPLPKQFLSLGGRSILERTLVRFNAHPEVREIVVVVPRAYLEKAAWIIHGRHLSKATRVVAGGRDRQESVWNGLNAFGESPRTVLIHDAVRPLVRRKVIDAVIHHARRSHAAVVGVKVKDTVKWEGKKGYVTKTLDRGKLWSIQTPQGFDYDLAHKAHWKARSAGFSGTDDAALVERLGRKVRIVEGDYDNIKITTAEDLAFAEMVLKKRG
jgi:2-C-methyl-D-erythritol 4-phosphate cytidylyltransferase